jgi:DnaK suppressor protein
VKKALIGSRVVPAPVEVVVKRLTKPMAPGRREALHRVLMGKRQELMQEITGNLGQSLTEDQRRRLESAMDVGDQSLMDLDRELGISLMEMRNKRRQLIDEALARLEEGTYGLCDECGVEINEKRLAAVPFAKLCVTCQSKQELMEKIEKGEEREQ